MARNEEKQQGRLNRLWLQKERDEGRLKDVRETRPKLSTLNTAASVKKWIPSIQKEIEYYLQQSQLTHYPERKIAEFQLRIEALEREYKRFIAKLRVLDPTCKHKPWTPRAYCKRRADQQEPQGFAKKLHTTSLGGSSELNEDESGVSSSWSGRRKTSTSESHPETKTITNVPLHMTGINSDRDNANQDLPLSFDQTRLAVATAPIRGSSSTMGLHKTNNLARVLQSGLPNLVNSTLSNNRNGSDNNLIPITESAQSAGCRYPVQEEKSQCVTEKWATGAILDTGVLTEGAGHILRLDCYSSSDDES